MKKVTPSKVFLHLTIWFFIVLSIYPLFFMVTTSFKDMNQFYNKFWGLAFPMHFENYISAWQAVYKYILNSLVITVASVVGTIIVSVLAGYSFGRFEFKLKNILFFSILALLMVPSLLTLVPLFLEINRLNLINNKLGLILPYIASNQVMAIFILKSHFQSLPDELFEAATIDGANEMQKLKSVALPLSSAMIGSIAILVSVSVWNDFILPMVVMGKQEQWTITLGLLNFQGQYAFNQSYGPMFSGYVLASLPMLILFLMTMKAFISGLTSGALKM